MINLYDGQITDLLQNSLKHNPETQAIAYAVLQEKRRLIDLVERTRLMSVVDSLEERILDYLAVELRTPAYESSLPLATKRPLIKGTLPFYAKLGTPAAVNWLIQTIFGAGHIEEWFDYDGEPHHFRVYVGETGQVSLENLSEFQQLLNSVKRLSSWLDVILVTKRPINSILHIGGAFGATQTLPVPEAPDGMKWKGEIRFGGAAAMLSVMPVPERNEKGGI